MKSLVDVYPYRKLEEQIDFLVCKRLRQAIYPGQWRMIGGKVHRGETAWEAALREMEEETGTRPIRFWTLPSLNHFYDTGADTIRLIPAFAGRLSVESEIILNEEHTEYKWISVDKIDSYIDWPEQKRLMKLTHRILTAGRIIGEWELEI